MYSNNDFRHCPHRYPRGDCYSSMENWIGLTHHWLGQNCIYLFRQINLASKGQTESVHHLRSLSAPCLSTVILKSTKISTNDNLGNMKSPADSAEMRQIVLVGWTWYLGVQGGITEPIFSVSLNHLNIGHLSNKTSLLKIRGHKSSMNNWAKIVECR